MLGLTVGAMLACTVFAGVALFADLTADCAEASSEISDPCAMGEFISVSWILLVWSGVMLALCYLAGALRNRLRSVS